MHDAAQIRKHRSAAARIFFWIVRLAIFFIVFSLAEVVVYKYVNPPFTPLMIGRWIGGQFNGDPVGIDYHWRDLDDISPNLQRAVIASEDRKFFIHHGFDWNAIQTNWDKLEAGEGRVKGASTISMQTARNVFLWQGRSWLRKGLEAYYTVLIEFFWGKRRILETYLNVIEIGNGIYGAEAASEWYFHHPAKFLAPPEAALIAAVLPNPRRWSPSMPTAFIRRRQAVILRRLSVTPLPRRFFDK